MCMHRRGKANITEQPQIGIRVVKSPTGWWIVVVHYCVYKGHGVDNNRLAISRAHSPHGTKHISKVSTFCPRLKEVGADKKTTVGAVTFVFYVKPFRAVGARPVHVVFSRTGSSDTAPRVAAHCACREL